jgi:hypothetical protein
MVLQKFEILGINVVAPYFALYESLSGSSIDSPIPSDGLILSLIDTWSRDNQPNAKFVFLIRLYVPAISGYTSQEIVASNLGLSTTEQLSLENYFQNAEITNSQILYLQYIQCLFNVITGQYPTTLELALELGAYHFIYKFQSETTTATVTESEIEIGNYSIGFLNQRIVEFLPATHLRGNALEEMERKLYEKVEEVRRKAKVSETVWNPQRKYLELVMTQLPTCYGITIFRCSQVTWDELPLSYSYIF